MNTTNKIAAALVAKALDEGHTLSISCPNGDRLTVGRRSAAVGSGGFHILRWGRSRFAAPSGLEVEWDPCAKLLAPFVVDHVGRGSAGRAAREALAINMKK